jgi:hypothetical protein
MQTYVVERYLTGWTGAEVAALLDRLDALAPEFLARAVTYVTSIVLDSDETCLSLFQGLDADQVRHVNLQHNLPTDRVVTATLAAAHEHGDLS